VKYHVVFKFLAILLAAACLTIAITCGVGIVLLVEEGIFQSTEADVKKEIYEQRAEQLASYVLRRYTTTELSEVPQQLLDGYFYGDEDISMWTDVEENSWHYGIYDDQNRLVESRKDVSEQSFVTCAVETTGVYLVETSEEGSWVVYDDIGSYYRWEESPVYTVKVSIKEYGVMVNGFPMLHIESLIAWRYSIIWVLVLSLFLLAVCMVYLCVFAGKSRWSAEPCPGGLNRLPLDLYAAVVFVIGFLAAFCIVEGLEVFSRPYLNWAVVTLTVIILLLVCLCVICWLFALAAQLKIKGHYWWHNSLIGRCIDLICRGIGFVFRGLRKLIELMPMVWRRVLFVAGLGLGVLLAILFLAGGGTFFGMLLLLATVGCGVLLMGYDIYAFGVVMKGARRMAEGKLDEEIPTQYLLSSYKEHAAHLNAIADVATVAAKRQMRSERMKAELITNVSHDIKTPLTSVINYVDLLQKPHTPEEQAQYLEVLERQSRRMKKLLEDLMDMSKASTGNVTVNIEELDAVETVNQALGEFSDKLSMARITPLLRYPESPLSVYADGKLTWRVLSNLLSNVVKYAQPDTRLYVDLLRADGRVWISLKNISREALNISADELTERFVRGDASRNTEGSGLGLNIAQSLMELQKGSLELVVDGDLFKVVLSFPTHNGTT